MHQLECSTILEGVGIKLIDAMGPGLAWRAPVNHSHRTTTIVERNVQNSIPGLIEHVPTLLSALKNNQARDRQNNPAIRTLKTWLLTFEAWVSSFLNLSHIFVRLGGSHGFLLQFCAWWANHITWRLIDLDRSRSLNRQGNAEFMKKSGSVARNRLKSCNVAKTSTLSVKILRCQHLLSHPVWSN